MWPLCHAVFNRSQSEQADLLRQFFFFFSREKEIFDERVNAIPYRSITPHAQLFRWIYHLSFAMHIGCIFLYLPSTFFRFHFDRISNRFICYQSRGEPRSSIRWSFVEHVRFVRAAFVCARYRLLYFINIYWIGTTWNLRRKKLQAAIFESTCLVFVAVKIPALILDTATFTVYKICFLLYAPLVKGGGHENA